MLVRTVVRRISFQHQQFQEWYASFAVEELMRKSAGHDDAGGSDFGPKRLTSPHGKSPSCLHVNGHRVTIKMVCKRWRMRF